MKFFLSQEFLLYFLIIFHVTKAATHWIVTEDGKIHTQEDSMFQMRLPYDLMSFLQQEKRADMFQQIKTQLLVQKEEIESDSFDNHDDVEQVMYSSNPDCLKANKPLTKFDLYVGTMIFAYPKKDHQRLPSRIVAKLFHQNSTKQTDNLSFFTAKNDWITFTSSNTSYRHRNNQKSTTSKAVDGAKDVGLNSKKFDDPICNSELDSVSDSLKFYSSEYLASFKASDVMMDSEPEIVHSLGKWHSLETFGNDISYALKQNPNSWIILTLASFYWRAKGRADHAVDCIFQAIKSSPKEFRPIPLLSLATVLHRSRNYEEAATVLHDIIEIAPEIPHSHYILANIYTLMTDYNRSIICLDNVLKLCPRFEEAKLRKHAVLCHNSIENALKTQHENLQKTLHELKDYQKQQEMWINYHQKLRSEQASPSVQLELRLQYQELKFRQKLDDERIANKKVSPNQSITEDGKTLIDMNLSHTKMKEYGQKLIDLYYEHQKLENDSGSESKNDDKLKTESKENKDETTERSNQIKKLLAMNINSIDDVESGKNADKDEILEDERNGLHQSPKNHQETMQKDDFDDDGIDEFQQCSENSRPLMLIPMTFVLPPTN
ncbi:Tetratricopeptide repeat protein 17 [Sarcoptes scabiei]|uniref:Tetratricopeptide repeat protein 17 n=1 Tax=Sarcoptes scabiei TaxID=52283 RepID=A0A834VC33_SARSC|nr:Tetratricopeptide repeat protein 17 [Sarcoptes scabiei]